MEAEWNEAVLISIHSPHTRGDVSGDEREPRGNISIHSPHTRGDALGSHDLELEIISIHSPHTRGDMEAALSSLSICNFNPLPSHEGRRLVGGAHEQD